ncbi:type II secretion system F family protein [Thermodesulfovibrio sp.]|uniref:type II secretion system F family protein n=1 Tax=Thermodesulfovibrio sp. TaxID=2067987 RepID=UPI0030B142F5
MNVYIYKALNREGKILRGLIKAENEQSVMLSLNLKNLYTVSVSKVPHLIQPILLALSKKVRLSDLIEFSKNLSIMLKAGIPLTTALTDIGENLSTDKFRRVIIDIRDMVEKGISFSDAIAMFPDVFPPIFQHLIKIGEETGKLDESLENLAEHFQKIEDLKTAIKRALIYPVFATVASLGAMGFWIVYVLPKIVMAMKDMGVKIPFITEVLLQAGILFQKFFYLFPVFILILLTLIQIFKKNERFRWIRSYLAFNVPIIKQILYTRAVALFCEQMRILIGAGVPIDRAFDMTRDVINNEIMKRAIENAKEKIMSGERIWYSLKEQKIFPSLLVRLIDVGESSGRLEEQLEFLNEYYTKSLHEYSARLGKVIEPVMIGVIGLFFAIVIISLLSPVYELISKIGKV